MRTARSTLVAVALALLASAPPPVNAAPAPPPPVFPVPVIGLSTLTAKTTDTVALIVQWSKRCTTGNACPTQHLVMVEHRGPNGYSEDVRRIWSGRTRDTVRIARPVCEWNQSWVSDTLSLQVQALTSANVEQSNVAQTHYVIRCRHVTAAERIEAAAFADSFPDANMRIETGDTQYRMSSVERLYWLTAQLRMQRTHADSVGTLAIFRALETADDSVRVQRTAAGAVGVTRGYTVALCWLGRNRYTNTVYVISGDVQACEPPRARMQSERSG